jgi:hypothetical protein
MMRQPLAQAPRAQRAEAIRPRPAARRPAPCGHLRYTKGCDICALVGIYQDHLNRQDLTSAERSNVIRLYQAGDKAGLFKLWQARS